MTNQAGYVVTDSEVIHATGETAQEAWANFLTTMRECGITVVNDVDGGEEVTEEMIENGHEYTRASQNKNMPASAALLANVETMGGNIVWHIVGGVCCTCDEA